MSSKFKIMQERQNKDVHLKLAGEFNDMSICELVDILKTNCSDGCNVFIHTSSLNKVSTSDFGRDVFIKNTYNTSNHGI